ncbi:hypothetical protein PIB30_036395 [Stylosanthes scabra]|uniref:Uncharacterized protein n=1 Tax=Stylosanthes scabra TaxID=79078 RepID=A0ABU6QDR2_9FABA|nr:hypothetical protein [Stylosanthes scabra]
MTEQETAGGGAEKLTGGGNTGGSEERRWEKIDNRWTDCCCTRRTERRRSWAWTDERLFCCSEMLTCLLRAVVTETQCFVTGYGDGETALQDWTAVGDSGRRRLKFTPAHTIANLSGQGLSRLATWLGSSLTISDYLSL